MDVKTIAVAILGGAFDSNELGDNDIACVPGALEDLQLRHVTGCDDVQLELVERSHVERLTAERDALQQLLNARDEEVDRLRNQLAQCEAMAMMVAEREWAEHVGTGPVSSKVEAAFTQLHSELQEAQGKLAERDTLLRDNSGKLIRMAAHLISAPLFALQALQDEDKKMTRARVDKAVDTADARLKDAAYELRRIADALSASAEPSAPKCGNCGSGTGQACNDKGCGYLESGNGEPSTPVAQCTNEDSWNCKYCRNTKSCEALKDPRNFGGPSAPVERDELPEFARRVIAKLKRFRDCAEDGQGADIGREWFDVLVKLGLLNRVQRSPALWEITDEGDALLEARAVLERKP